MAKAKAAPEFYVQDMQKIWSSPSMQKYCVEEYSNHCVFPSGKYVVVGKRSIETDFCFDDSFDYDGAQNMAEHARTSETYFIHKNLEYYDNLIKRIKERTISLRPKYYNQPQDCMLCDWREEDDWDEINRNAEYLTTSEKKLLIAMYEEEKAKFEKRLHTYLKRYGLSKVHSWTYWGMA